MLFEVDDLLNLTQHNFRWSKLMCGTYVKELEVGRFRVKMFIGELHLWCSS